MAAVWKAPVVFIIENNLYGEYSAAPRRRRRSTTSPSARRRYGMPGVDRRRPGRRRRPRGGRATRSSGRARGEGPTLLEMKTYRYRGHSRTDPAKYRPEGELDALAGARPDRRSSAAQLAADGVLSDEDAGSAPRRDPGRGRRRPPTAPQQAPVPDPRGDRSVCLRRLRPSAAADGRRRVEMTYREAINAALEDELAADPAVYLHGRGRRDRRRRLQDQRRARREVRPRARPEHADLRERLRRRRARDGRHGLRPDRRDHVQPTSCRRPATRSSTSCRSTASCRAASATCPSRSARSAAATGRFGTQHSATGE